MPKEDTQFRQGESGNPMGRPKGSRNKLSEGFLSALSDDFDECGRETIKKLRETNPAQYCNVIGRLMPKLMELSGPEGAPIATESVPFVMEFVDAYCKHCGLNQNGLMHVDFKKGERNDPTMAPAGEFGGVDVA